MKLLIILISLLYFSNFAFGQNEDVNSIKIQRIKKNGKIIERIFNPNKTIEILDNKNNIYRFNKPFEINDSFLIIKTDTLSLKNILNIKGTYRGSSIYKTLKIVFISTGISLLHVAIIGRIAHPYGGSGDYNNIKEYDNYLDNLKMIGALGGISLATGWLIISKKGLHNTKDNWQIKPGFYKTNK